MLPTVRHTKYGRIRGMVVGEGGRSSGVLLYRSIHNKVNINIAILTYQMLSSVTTNFI